MSLLDKAIAAVTPPESEEARLAARAKAVSIAPPGGWLSQVLQHHQEIEAQFAAVKAAATADARRTAQQKLAVLLTAHSVAEEAALYPAMAAHHQPGHAELAYQEQSAAKMEMGLLERLDPMSKDYNDKLEHIEGAVAHHVYTEEGTWFIELAQSVSPAEQAVIQTRYQQEYDRYSNGQ